MAYEQGLPSAKGVPSSKTKRHSKSKSSRTSAATRANRYRQASSFQSQHSRNKRQRNDERYRFNQVENDNLDIETVREILSKNKRDKDLSPSELDELLDDHERQREQTDNSLQSEEQKAAGVTVGSIKVPLYGTLQVEQKGFDVIRVMSLNINGIKLWSHNNHKRDRLKFVLKNYGVDVLGIQETNCNFRALKASHTLASELRHTDDRIRSVEAHNTIETKNITPYQPGGVAVVVRDEMAGLQLESGKDPKKLGMFAWYCTPDVNGVRTIFVSAYAPCSAKGESTYYQHIERYLQKHHLDTNPKDFFRDSLIEAIVAWRKSRYRVVLMIDANENVLDGSLSKRLAEDDIKMREAVHRAMSRGRGPPTHFRGTRQGNGAIDGIFISDDIELISASYLPFDETLGDHRPVLIDIQVRSVLGKELVKIVPPKARRLNSRIPRHRDKYLQKVKEGFKRNKIEKRLRAVETAATFPPTSEVVDSLETIDRLIESILLKAEKECRIIYPAHYEFSPEIKSWLDLCHLLRWILRRHQGKRINQGNLRRFAKRLGHSHLLFAPVEEVVHEYKSAREQAKKLMQESPYLRKTFLHEKLNDAIDAGRDKEAARVRAELKSEAARKTWRGIKQATKPRGNTSVTRIEVPQSDGQVIEHTTKESIEAAVMQELSTRFGMASGAPICQGALFDLLGVYADTDAAMEILEGTFIPPIDTPPWTIVLLEEIARIWQKMGEGEVSIAVSQEDYQYYWRKVKERTSSSLSGLHFGHYKSIAHDDYLSGLMAKKLTLISTTGSAPERWARGLSVMLEKIAGVALVTKLRGILLLEADYNQHSKLIFGKRMLDLARKNGLVPEEIYSEKGRTAEDAILQQVLMYDIARMSRRPLLVAQVDAAQCYDRVATAVSSLTLQAFKTPKSSVLTMLRPLHNMEFFLRTGFGQSSTFFGGKHDGKHGLAQGNGAAPPTWQQVSTVMLSAMHRKGHGVDVVCPISKTSSRQIGIFYVDDVNAWAGLGEHDDLMTTSGKGQESINCWGGMLQATGGALKGQKCSVMIHDMVTDGKGNWVYTDKQQKKKQSFGEDEEDELDDLDEWKELKFTVPTEDGDTEAIKILSTDEADQNLGFKTRPDGKWNQQFKQMQERATTWTAQIKSGHIPTRSVWMSYTHQLWSGLRYGLGACSAPLGELAGALGSADFYLLSNLGVVRTIKKEWRYLPPSLGGMGLFDLPIETAAATISSFLQHYETNSALGHNLKAAMEHLQVEIGVSDCPFNYDYGVWGILATESWPKALWEKLDNMGIIIDIKYHSIPTPRRKDKTIMQCAVDAGKRNRDLRSINRVRIVQEAFFLSDITSANGKYIEKHLFDDTWCSSEEGLLGKHRSTLDFGREVPTKQDWKVWQSFLRSISSSNLLLETPLEQWVNPSTRIWRYMYHEEECLLEVHTDDQINIFEQTSTDRTNVLTWTHSSDTALTGTIPVDIQWLSDEKVKFIRRGQPLQMNNEETEQMTFRDRLLKKGGEWMWKNLRGCADDVEWIVDAIQRGSLYCVTDGSYIKELAPDVCGAAWVLFCAETNKWINGEFAEQSPGADSYRGEQLGMLAIHLLLLAIEEHYATALRDARIFCDNIGSIQTFSKDYRRVKSAARNNDVLRVLRTIQQKTKLTHTLSHVSGHQDDHTRYDTLSLEAKLNVDCDIRAKRAIREYLRTREDSRPKIFRLPLETAAIYIDGVKQTADFAAELRYYVGKQRARQFYVEQKIMDTRTFDTVAWEDIRCVIDKRPRMYQLWYGKQCSGFCGTGTRVKRYDREASDKCPNCGKLEDATHLTQCSDKLRRQILQDSITEIVDWMVENDSHPELIHWLPTFLSKQGRIKWVDLVHPSGIKMTQGMRQVGNSQDRIGYRHFTEGKLSLELRKFQAEHLSRVNTHCTIDRWMKGMIDSLLTMTHKQWLCRNLTKHHATKGSKALATKAELRKEIEHYLSLGLDGLPEGSKFLLEISPDELYNRSIPLQQYWINANEAARQSTAPLPALSERSPPSQYRSRTSPTVTSPTTAQPSQPVFPIFRQRPSTTTQHRQTLQPANLHIPPPNTSSTDRVGILRSNTPAELQAIPIGAFMRAQRHPSYDLTFSGSGDTVLFTSIKTLNPRLWINDEVINAFLLRVLKPKISPSRVYIFSSFFMSALMNTGPNGTLPPTFTYSNVKSWDRKLRRAGKILSVPEIFVPINYRQEHWLFLRANTSTKCIQLWDPQGLKPSNQVYMEYMLGYLGRKYLDHHECTQDDAIEWMETWTLTDESAFSPSQHNGHDCGLFLLTSITLLSQRFPLSPESYTEGAFQELQTRQRVALLLWKASNNNPRLRRTDQPRSLPNQPQQRGKPKAAKRTTTSKARMTTRPTTISDNKQRRRKKHTQIIPGGTKTRGKVHYEDSDLSEQLEGLINRKRSASSVASARDALPQSTQRHAPPKKRRRKDT